MFKVGDKVKVNLYEKSTEGKEKYKGKEAKVKGIETTLNPYKIKLDIDNNHCYCDKELELIKDDLKVGDKVIVKPLSSTKKPAKIEKFTNEEATITKILEGKKVYKYKIDIGGKYIFSADELELIQENKIDTTEVEEIETIEEEVEFKVGDIVEVIGITSNLDSNYNKLIGQKAKIVKISENTVYPYKLKFIYGGVEELINKDSMGHCFNKDEIKHTTLEKDTIPTLGGKYIVNEPVVVYIDEINDTKAVAKCHYTDKFDIEKGMKIACTKSYLKYINKEQKFLERQKKEATKFLDSLI